ncbi:MAG: MFS transporter [Butyrivibrio sp.]|nr:MFS transporter [Butyrivibrio sp.]
MYSLLLAIIYLAFISLGLPDSLLGSAWPAMHPYFSVPISYAGIISMIISGGTIASSLLSDRITRKFGTKWVTAVSVAITAFALLGFSLADKFYILCILAVPYGLGAGAIDAALNNYVALHYSSRHMSWLHCFWGVGTIISPYIMSIALSNYGSWKLGYRIVFIIQIIISAILFLSVKLWNCNKVSSSEENIESVGVTGAFKIPGVKPVLAGFLCYCAAESTTLLWASSYLVEVRGVAAEKAAAFGSMFCIGITAGRFISGFISEKLSDKNLIRAGITLMCLGIAGIAIPFNNDILSIGCFMIIGLGCAPVYPSIIHSTPGNFGKQNSQAIIGIQMASAYVGSTFMPPLFGLIAQHIDIRLLPIFLMFFSVLLAILTERVNIIMKNRSAQ